MKKIFIRFYGCQANLDDGTIAKGLLSKKKYKFTNDIKKSDICIIGTCIVKNPTANKIIYQLKEIYNSYNKKLIIAGCMPEAETNACRKMFPKASLINTYNITQTTKVVNSSLKNKKLEFLGKRKEIKLGLPKINKKIVTIQIAQGCTSNCTFCETKLAKGFIYSYPEKLVIKEIKYYLKKRIKRFNLTSTDNSDYGKDINTNIINLLNKIIKLKGNFKIRIGMMNPQNVLPILNDLIQIYKSDKIIKFLHIPAESFSDKILKDMNRNYTYKEFKQIVKKFRNNIPNINISTDLIAGYPTETNEDFILTCQRLKEIHPEVLNISKFSSRPLTQASKLKQLSSKIIKERSKKLTKIYKNQNFK